MIDRHENHQVSRRSFLTIFGAGTGAVVLAACGGAAAPSVPTSAPPAAPTTAAASKPAATAPAATAPAAAAAQPTAAAAPQPKTGGTLQAAKLGDVANLDGHYWSPNNGLHVWLAYDTLARYDQNVKPQPQLAESWDVSSDWQADHGQPAQGRHVSQRSGVHRRRRGVEPAASAESESHGRHSRRLLRSGSHIYREGQIHGPAADLAAVADGVRHVPRREHARQGQHRRGQQYADQGGWHRPVRVPGMAPGRGHALHQEPELLAVRQAVPG